MIRVIYSRRRVKRSATQSCEPRDSLPPEIEETTKSTYVERQQDHSVPPSVVVAARVIEYKVIDEWKLSDDGKVLTRISQIVFQGSNAMFVPAIVPDTKKVYNRT